MWSCLASSCILPQWMRTLRGIRNCLVRTVNFWQRIGWRVPRAPLPQRARRKEMPLDVSALISRRMWWPGHMGKSVLGLEDGEFRDRYAAPGTSLSPSSSEHFTRPCDWAATMNKPANGWPAYRISFPQGSPHRCPSPPTTFPSFGGLSPSHVFVRDGGDPVSQAL